MYILTKNEKIENISCVRFGEDIVQLITVDGNSTTIRKDIILTIADDTEDLGTILDRVSRNYENSTDFIEGNMPYHREYIPESDMDKLKDIIKKYGDGGKSIAKWHRFREWVVNKDRNDYLVKLYGDGYIDKRNVGVFVLNRNSKIIRIEAIYDIAGRSMEGCSVYWQISKIEIPLEVKAQTEIILRQIDRVFRVYGIGCKAIIDEFKLKFACEPVYV